jgi:hypothetical protein
LRDVARLCAVPSALAGRKAQVDAVELARQFLALGAVRFEVGEVKVEFSPAAVARALVQPAQPVDADTFNRLKQQAEEERERKRLEVDLWSA